MFSLRGQGGGVMPFTSDSRSRLEGFLQRGFVTTMEQPSERHVTPSAHRIVGTLMAETAPATAPVHVLDTGVADAPADTGDPGHAGDAEVAGDAGHSDSCDSCEDRADAASAASFEALM